MKRTFVLVIAAAVVVTFAGRIAGSGQSASSEHVTPSDVPNSTVVVQNYYYAQPGKAEEVYQWRVHASDVREKLGFPRGRVLRRIEIKGQTATSEDLPDVIWQCEYTSAESRERDSKAVGATPEFQAVQKHMATLTRHFARGTYQVEEPPPPSAKQ